MVIKLYSRMYITNASISWRSAELKSYIHECCDKRGSRAFDGYRELGDKMDSRPESTINVASALRLRASWMIKQKYDGWFNWVAAAGRLNRQALAIYFLSMKAPGYCSWHATSYMQQDDQDRGTRPGDIPELQDNTAAILRVCIHTCAGSVKQIKKINEQNEFG